MSDPTPKTPAPVTETENKPPVVDTDPLVVKNRELLAETKAERAARRELEAKLAEFENAKAKAAEEEAKKRGDFEKLEAEYKQREAAAVKKYQDYAIGNALKASLIAVNVTPAALEAVEALMRAKGATLGRNDEPLIDGKPLQEYIKDWAASDVGRFFIAAPNSSGGGASGGSAASGIKTMTRAAFNGLSPVEQMEFSKAGGRLT